MDEFTAKEQNLLLEFIKTNQSLIISDVLKSRV